MSGDIPADANENCVGPNSKEAGNASACEGCPNQSVCASGKGGEKDPEITLIAERLSGIKDKVLVLSGKGGVGKSTVCAQLAWLLSSLKRQVGVLDVDICGPSIPRLFNVENEEIHKSNYGWSPVYVNDHLCVMSVGFMLNSRNDAIVWRGPRKNGLIRQFLTDVNWADVNILLVDTPPGTSDEHISIVRYLEESNINGAIIVTTPQELSLLDVRKELTFCKKVGLKVIGVIENMSGFTCPNCAKDAVPKMCEEFGVKYLGSIRFEKEIGRNCDEGKSLFAIDEAKKATVSEQTKATLMAAVNAIT